ncbi:intermembrane transport protein PqiB [Vibrio porteresiae]|uniref:Intermembrane transport protein PqiB n=1 Tax=Vibrio porteresiae DSM 19223 TaxID=1123496 RepID=A0ABZ0QFE8_9VIBR|nr:intermembrane transport protein PqiB [Vibrio porteresiae]WPC75206.1 intermembrane transport protein PqiB [Vibrio porteresiae DSM 19223]
MTEPTLQSRPTTRFSFNPVWVVPLLALFVAAWMLYQDWDSQGPQLTVIANNADGIEAGKTKVKVHNVDVGEVTQVKLSDDFEHAIITIELQKGSDKLLRQDTKFWVIKPRVGTAGISGLGTLLSGAYIEAEPGTSGDAKREYTMLAQPPLSTADDKGLRLELVSKDIPKMTVGTPIHFHGFDVGHIEDVNFDPQQQNITYRLFIREPFDSLVSDAVQFWVTPGLAIQSSTKGIAVKMDSLETLITGGISFGTTEEGAVGKPVKDMTRFTLYESKEQATDNRYTQAIPFMFLFDGNIGGLEPGAPIEFRGVRIGTVQQVPFQGVSIRDWSATMLNPVLPVLGRIEPQRLSSLSTGEEMNLTEWRQLLDNAIKRGFRASLVTSNILTGSKIISVDFDAQAKPAKAEQVAGYPVFPSVPNSFDSLGQKFASLLDKLNNLPLNDTMNSLDKTLQSANDTLKTLNTVSKQIDTLLAAPHTQQLPEQLTLSLQDLQRTLKTYQEEGAVGSQLQKSLGTLERTLNDLQPVLRQLQQKPNALIFESNAAPDTIPTKGGQ